MKNPLLFLTLMFISRGTFAQTAMDWIPFSPSPNNMVYCFSEYDGKLIAAGMFDSIGNSRFDRIASWDGSSWSNLGTGLRGGHPSFGTFVYDSRVYNNELYVFGNFDTAGTIATKNIAKWNGLAWSGFGTGADTAVFSTAMYNNELYAAGAFKNIGGIQANFIAKWNGTGWQTVGNNSLKGQYVSALYVFQNQLYAAGALDSVNGNSCHYIARWNGMVWDTVGGGLQWQTDIPGSALNEPKFALIEWNNYLLLGSVSNEFDLDYSVEIHQWDGSNWSLFSIDNNSGFTGFGLGMPKIRKFLIYNNILYASGGIGSIYAQNTVFEWNNSASTWKKVGNGIGPSSRALGEYNGELYCGGSFDKAHGSYHNYFAKLGDVTGLNKENQKLEFRIYPNPASGILKLMNDKQDLENSFNKVTIYNSLGQLIKEMEFRTEIGTEDLPTGVYSIRLSYFDQSGELTSTVNKRFVISH